jgi:hypothetical protein
LLLGVKIATSNGSSLCWSTSFKTEKYIITHLYVSPTPKSIVSKGGKPSVNLRLKGFPVYSIFDAKTWIIPEKQGWLITL